MTEAENRRFLQWLEEISLGQYVAAFAEQNIDFDIAEELDDGDLKDIGIAAIGDRKRFLKAIGDRGGDGAPPSVQAIPEGERRQVTVLFADISGYTTLSNRLDAEEVHAMLNRFFDLTDGVIREYGGTIDKHIGDAVMAVFGAPVAHTDDPVRAVLAALEIHRRLGEMDNPIPAHIGIASGEVVASGTGSDKYQEYTVTGTTVNLASRLDDLAKAGDTFVNDEVFDAVSDAIVGRVIGDVAIRGLDTPVSVWSIEGRRDQSDRLSATELFGRKPECAAFEGAAADCREAGESRLFYLRGEPGIGKSRLAEAFRDSARDQGFVCLEAMILDFGADTARGAVRTITSGLIDPAANLAGEALIASAIENELISVPQEVHLYELLDITLPAGLRGIYDAMDNDVRRRGRQEALATLLQNASEAAPQFIYIDNLHWADRGTLSLLLALLKAARRQPVIFVFTSRIEGDPWAGEEAEYLKELGCMTIDLQDLGQDEARQMAETLGLTNLDYIEQCRERAGGNPLFLDQLFRSVIDGTGDSLPATIQSVVLARMDSLDTDDRRALQAASVMGQRFSLELLRALLGRSNYSCDELVRRALVRPDGDDFLFSHALVVDGVYHSLLNAQRQAMHKEVAAWYADRDVALEAQHLDRAGLPEAARAYHQAAMRDVEAYRYEPALQFIERGLELAAAAEVQVPLSCLKGDVLLALGQAEESIAIFEQAAALAETPAEQVRAQIGVAAGARIVGAVDDGLAALKIAEGTAGDLPLDRERAQIHYYRGTLLYSRGDLAGGLAAQERTITFAEAAADQQWLARGLSGLGDAQYAYGKMPAAYASFLKCSEICQANGYGQIEVANRPMVLNMRRYMNEFRQALDGMPGTIEMARQVGNLRAEMLALLLYGEFLTDSALYPAALDGLERALEISHSFGNKRMATYLLDHQARAFAGAGQLAEAQSAIDEAWRMARETDPAFIGARVSGTRALLAPDASERAQALADGEDILQAGVLAHNVIWFLRDAIDASLAAGAWDEAASYTDRLEETTRADPIPWCDYFIERGRALGDHGRGIDARERLLVLSDRSQKIALLAALPAIERALSETKP